MRHKIFFILLFPLLLFADWQEELKQKVVQDKPPSWMLEQIREDLIGIETADLSDERLNQTIEQNNYKCFLTRFKIQSGMLSAETVSGRKRDCRFKQYQNSLEELSKCLFLPNVEFIVSLADAIDNAELPSPVFAFAKNILFKRKIILIPDFEVLQQNEIILESISKGIEKYPWKKKKSKAFWRGACTGGTYNLDNFTSLPRAKLGILSLSHPEWIDAKLVSPLIQSTNPSLVQKTFADYFGKPRSLKEHLKYKYQILIDGNTCAYSRAYWQLFSNCLIFKQDSPNVQWYYRALSPSIHYISFKDPLDDLLFKIEWANRCDDESKTISKNAQKFANENLKKSDIYYYIYLLLREYSKIQNL